MWHPFLMDFKKQISWDRHFGGVPQSFRAAVRPGLESLFCQLPICKLGVTTGPASTGWRWVWCVAQASAQRGLVAAVASPVVQWFFLRLPVGLYH